ncbi:MAG: D-2-hydroxyacid dehydrogenase [Spirochaetaceae bacterium]|jgi:phosphoglycerate dehydrogenase-like enzyme|nr:D-2-hydroxyacid dehydrogenase [Spirochaetaceae bacterium]
MDQYKGTQDERGIILLARPRELLPAGAVERLRQAGEGREVRITANKGEIEPVLEEVEIGFGDVPFSLIPRMPRLKWIQLWSAGADQLQRYPEVKALPFRLTSASGMHGPQLTEHIFALLLARNRLLRRAFAAQDRHEWRQFSGAELPVLSGKTMLILGYGAIGESLARAALAFGMRVIGLRRRVPAPGTSVSPSVLSAASPSIPSSTPSASAAIDSADPRLIITAAGLPEFLPGADVVVNILPLTPATRRLFGEEEFFAMKQDAIYVNVGRGATTDEAALIEALRTGRIGGALLDVAEQEPLSPRSPLWDMENVIITGHYGGLRMDYDSFALDIALDNLGRYVRGEPLRNPVDKEQGY